jgi:predicted metal-dependent hydrolase
MQISIDRLFRSHRKTIALVVERDGKLTVRAPLRMTEFHIRDFVEKHADWIIKNQGKIRAACPPSVNRYLEGESFYYLGNKYPLTMIPHQLPALTFDGQNFKLAKSALPKAEQAFKRWYKSEARFILAERVRILANKNMFVYQNIRVSSARTRWGSCSSYGNLSFTYRLIMAPPEIVDYVVVHELVHTRIRNHSKTFWQAVEGIMPDYKKHLNWLKKNGQLLI